MKQKQSKQLKIVEKLKKEGWIFEQFRCYKKVGKLEIDIEFCIGDFCLGIYDESLSLLEPKQRCDNFWEAFIKSLLLEEKYE